MRLSRIQPFCSGLREVWFLVQLGLLYNHSLNGAELFLQQKCGRLGRQAVQHWGGGCSVRKLIQNYNVVSYLESKIILAVFISRTGESKAPWNPSCDGLCQAPYTYKDPWESGEEVVSSSERAVSERSVLGRSSWLVDSHLLSMSLHIIFSLFMSLCPVILDLILTWLPL